MSEDIRFLYLRDVKSPRTVTVARRLVDDGKAVEFAFSVNHPDKMDRFGFVRFHGDRFDKTVGRNIARGRLLSGKSFKVELRADQRPIEAVISTLAYGDNMQPSMVFPMAVQAIAQQSFIDAVELGNYSNPDDMYRDA